MKKLEHLGEKCRQKESTRRGSSAGAGQGAQQEVTPEIVLRYGLSIFNDDDEKDILTNKDKPINNDETSMQGKSQRQLITISTIAGGIELSPEEEEVMMMDHQRRVHQWRAQS